MWHSFIQTDSSGKGTHHINALKYEQGWGHTVTIENIYISILVQSERRLDVKISPISNLEIHTQLLTTVT